MVGYVQHDDGKELWKDLARTLINAVRTGRIPTQDISGMVEAEVCHRDWRRRGDFQGSFMQLTAESGLDLGVTGEVKKQACIMVANGKMPGSQQ